jgi:hypothetical protein
MLYPNGRVHSQMVGLVLVHLDFPDNGGDLTALNERNQPTIAFVAGRGRDMCRWRSAFLTHTVRPPVGVCLL